MGAIVTAMADMNRANSLNTEIQYLKGVGPKRAAYYHKLDIYTIRDLLYHFPRSYINYGNTCPIAELPIGELQSVRARVMAKSPEQHIRKGLSVFKVKAADDSGEILLTFYNTKYTVDALQLDTEYYFFGKTGGNLYRHEMSSPMVFPVDGEIGMSAVYPLTAGLTSRSISANIANALSLCTGAANNFEDYLPSDIRLNDSLCQLEYAIRNIHMPTDIHAAEIAKRRLIFDEFFILSISLGIIKAENKVSTGCKMEQVSIDEFYQALPFTPTNAQKRSIQEACADMCGQIPMNRLIQGDVGSGKTLIAAACCYFAKKNGYQSAMMAPTEILAAQHGKTFEKLFASLDMKVAVLTGSQPAAEKRDIRERLKNGEIDLCVGTHALLSENVLFQSLALVVTDEQHRFGVAQRVKLAQKGDNPHLLVMSATPIPRTLALLVYGDLDISIIDELPPNRQPIATYRIDSRKRERAYHFIKDHLDQGRQGYIVCPLIEQGEMDTGLKPAVDYAAELAESAFQGYRVGLLHGKMKQTEKDEVMAQFQSGEIQLLVSTTVVEVGVDVPNAVIMMIENAERFGLSQLHQLRGRVGRGQYRSYCILLSDAKNKDTLQRLQVMCRTTNGFEIAQQDLEMRGPGDFLGYRQHGLPQFAIADMAKDMSLLQAAQSAASQLIEKDSSLSLPEHQGIREKVQKVLSNVGERVN